ncbi:hypothetical protein DE146DRAFT_633098 [Phaeosphaeria sp. MPI-PUGE-AT-0046c]|nr:hypothetical protein DE146DRAFT_633098 [Phaeosphaeria sp. MPI-PUGE-AT-0046c]
MVMNKGTWGAAAVVVVVVARPESRASDRPRTGQCRRCGLAEGSVDAWCNVVADAYVLAMGDGGNEAVAPQTIGLAGTLATFLERKRSRAVKDLQQDAAGRTRGGRDAERRAYIPVVCEGRGKRRAEAGRDGE